MVELLTKKAEEGIGKFVDNVVKLPVWAEPFDGFIVTQAIRYIDITVADKIPENFRVIFEKINEVFEKYNETGEFNLDEILTVEDLTEVVNTLIDIPSLTEEEEAILFSGFLAGIFQVIKTYIVKK